MKFRYMLDSNTISNFLKGNANVAEHVESVDMGVLCISSIVEGESRYGLAKRPEAHQLNFAVEAFLENVETAAWDSDTAKHYGKLRAQLEKSGTVLSPMDMLIAAHALSLNLTLVTSDKAFRYVDGLSVEDWTRD